jgi:hypothetical protein
VEDLFGLGEDRWWERVLAIWERIPHGFRTALVGGLMGGIVVGFFLLLNSWTQMPVG